jgi:hypothetical protein
MTSLRLLTRANSFRSRTIAEAPGDSSQRGNTQSCLFLLTSVAVISIAQMEDDLPDVWTAHIRVPASETGDVPVLVAFMHTDEPQCAL